MTRIFIWLAFLILPFQPSYSWGFFGHKTINYAAIFTLPPEMFGFYKLHAFKIRELAVNADKRRYAIADEAPRHYLDADFYEDLVPLDTIPKQFDSAVARYGLDTVLAHGIVPWHIVRVTWWLTKAFAGNDVDAIIRLSADLGHYAGDLHVPLHSTHNYNGQLTNQHGIHGFWESRLPELYAQEYDFFVGKAVYIHDVETIVWQRFEESFAAKDSVLLFEKELRQQLHDDQLYSYELRGQSLVKTQSQQFSDQYHNRLDNMVERRMQQSIFLVGSLWMTAWIDAGQPDLSALDQVDSSRYQVDTLVHGKKMIGRPEFD